jgi:hypothetical protein
MTWRAFCIGPYAKVSNHLELLKPDPADPPDKYERDKAGR